MSLEDVRVRRPQRVKLRFSNWWLGRSSPFTLCVKVGFQRETARRTESFAPDEQEHHRSWPRDEVAIDSVVASFHADSEVLN